MLDQRIPQVFTLIPEFVYKLQGVVIKKDRQVWKPLNSLNFLW